MEGPPPSRAARPGDDCTMADPAPSSSAHLSDTVNPTVADATGAGPVSISAAPIAATPTTATTARRTRLRLLIAHLRDPSVLLERSPVTGVAPDPPPGCP